MTQKSLLKRLSTSVLTSGTWWLMTTVQPTKASKHKVLPIITILVVGKFTEMVEDNTNQSLKESQTALREITNQLQ